MQHTYALSPPFGPIDSESLGVKTSTKAPTHSQSMPGYAAVISSPLNLRDVVNMESFCLLGQLV